MSLSAGEVTAIIIGIGNFTAWAKLFADARKNGRNGNGKQCSLHSGIISQIETGEKQKTDLADEIKNLHVENRQDHQQIFTDIKALSISVAGAAAAAATAASAAVAFATKKRGKA